MEMSYHVTWDQKVNLIGKKVEDPRLHLCEKCNFPILIYGRMIPCKHVFCFDCAKATEKTCLRCGDNVSRIEQSLQGHIFMCDYGAPKHSHEGCRRTYLSKRDLQAHINHRHKKQSQKPHDRRPSDPRTEPRGERPEPRKERTDPRLEARNTSYQQMPNYSVASKVPIEATTEDTHNYSLGQSGIVTNPQGGQGEYHMEQIPVRNTNLITVPLQDSGADYPGGVQYANPTAPLPPRPVQTPYSGPPIVPAEHQAPHPVQSQMPYPVSNPHVAPVLTQQPPGYSSSTTTIPPPATVPVPQTVPYNMAPPAVPPNPVVHYEQPPPDTSSYGATPSGHPTTTYSAPVTGSWTAPTPSHSVPGQLPATENTAPSQSMPVLPDSTTYHGSYY